MITFDATVSFEEPLELEHALTQALREIGDFHALTVVIRHDDDTGEIYRDDDEIPDIRKDDWCVTGCSIWDIASQLRNLV